MKLTSIFVNIVLFICLVCSTQLFATLEMGAGINSSTSGRIVPGIAVGAGANSWLMTATSSGVKNDYYYRSTYSLSAFATWKTGTFIWGDIVTGVGAGAVYSENGFQDDGAASLKKDSDIAVGPAFKVKWFLLGPIYMNMEAILGLRNPGTHLLSLQFQDFVTLSFGVSI